MRASEVMNKLGITSKTLFNYVKSGKIKVKQKFSSKLFIYDDESVEQFLRDSFGENGSPAESIKSCDGMKTREVLDLLGITQPTLFNYVKAGKIKVKQKLSKRLFIYDKKSVEQFLKETSC